MLTLLVLPIVVCLPFVFAIYGKQIFGAQTVPAALFILAWFATTILLSFVQPAAAPSGVIALVWVTFCFTAHVVVKKFKRKPDSE